MKRRELILLFLFLMYIVSIDLVFAMDLTPREIKENTITALQNAKTGSPEADSKTNLIINSINKSLSQEAWLGNIYLDNKNGENVFNNEIQAVNLLYAQLKANPQIDLELKKIYQDALGGLVKADKLIVENLMINGVETCKSYSAKIDNYMLQKAKVEFNLGKVYMIFGLYNNAITRFKKAWDFGQKAIKKNPLCVIGIKDYEELSEEEFMEEVEEDYSLKQMYDLAKGLNYSFGDDFTEITLYEVNGIESHFIGAVFYSNNLNNDGILIKLEINMTYNSFFIEVLDESLVIYTREGKTEINITDGSVLEAIHNSCSTKRCKRECMATLTSKLIEMMFTLPACKTLCMACVGSLGTVTPPFIALACGSCLLCEGLEFKDVSEVISRYSECWGTCNSDPCLCGHICHSGIESRYCEGNSIGRSICNDYGLSWIIDQNYLEQCDEDEYCSQIDYPPIVGIEGCKADLYLHNAKCACKPEGTNKQCVTIDRCSGHKICMGGMWSSCTADPLPCTMPNGCPGLIGCKNGGTDPNGECRQIDESCSGCKNGDIQQCNVGDGCSGHQLCQNNQWGKCTPDPFICQTLGGCDGHRECFGGQPIGPCLSDLSCDDINSCTADYCQSNICYHETNPYC